MANYQRRDPMSGRERDQDWNDRPRSREERWDDDERGYARSGYEQESGETDYDRDIEERASSRSREGEGDGERGREHGGGRDWRERERGWGREASYGREGSSGREGGWGNEGRYGRPSWGSEGGMGRQRESRSSFGGHDPSWRYGGSAYEPYYRAARARGEGRGAEQYEEWRASGSVGYGSNYGAGASYGGGQGYGSQSIGGQGYSSGQYGGAQMRQGGGMRGSQSPWRSGGPHSGKGPKDFRRSDERLREEISEHLMADPDIDASELTVNVKDGEVTLEGTVPDRQTKRDAEDCAENVLGVRQVNNRLRIAERASRGSGSNLSRGYEVSGQQRGQPSGQTGQQSSPQSQSSEMRASNRITGKGDSV